MPTIKTTTSYKEAIDLIDNEIRVVYIAQSKEHAIAYTVFMHEHNIREGKYKKYNKCDFLEYGVVIVIDPQDLPQGVNHGLYASGFLCKNVRSTYSYPYSSKDITDKMVVKTIEDAIENTGLKNTIKTKKELKSVWSDVSFSCCWIREFTVEMLEARENYSRRQSAIQTGMKQKLHDMIEKAVKAFHDDVEVAGFHREKSWSGASMSDEWTGVIFEKDGTAPAARMKFEVVKTVGMNEFYIRYSSTYLTTCSVTNPTVEKLISIISAVKNFVQVAYECEEKN